MVRISDIGKCDRYQKGMDFLLSSLFGLPACTTGSSSPDKLQMVKRFELIYKQSRNTMQIEWNCM